MTEILWTSTVTCIGPDAQEMIDAGVIILFGEPVPSALADVSVVHEQASAPQRDLVPGDEFVIGDNQYLIDQVGEQAAGNLRELGHIVLYVNSVDQKLLPGAVHVSGDVIAPTSGQQIILRSA